MKVFTASDVINFAIRVEEDGEMFYRKAAQAVSDQGVKDLFGQLADAEVAHKKLFREMLGNVETIAPGETYEGEYAAYLSDYIDGKVIFTGDREKEALSAAGDTQAALVFAMGREADSILYYHEAKRLVASKYHDAIDKIIEEERSHFNRLAAMKKTA